MRECWKCLDKGLVRWVEEKKGAVYEYIGACDCRRGREWENIAPAAQFLDPAEIWKIEEENKKALEEPRGL